MKTKKYHIKHLHLTPDYNYLIYIERTGEWFVNNLSIFRNAKSQFTLAELPDWVHEMLEQGHLVKEEVE